MTDHTESSRVSCFYMLDDVCSTTNIQTKNTSIWQDLRI